MLRCAILDDYQGVALRFGEFSRLEDRVEFTVFRDNLAETDGLIARLADFDIIIAMRERTPFDRERLNALPRLKLLVTTGMKNASIDVAAARECGIVVCGTPGFVGSTSELAWGLLLGLTLAVLGLGNLGSRLAKMGLAFGMDVHGWSRKNTPERSAGLGIRYAPDLDGLLARADVISIHLPLNAETRGLIDARRFGLMKPDAIIINTSRGPILDEAALIAALENGQIGGAGLDVFDTEPLPADHPFRRLSNVLATPHLGYVTENTYKVFFGGAVEDVEAWLAGTPIRILT